MKTCATDGRRLVANPAWVQEQSWDDLCFDLAHLVGHCMFGHPFRRADRDLDLYNEAGDHVVNHMLREDGSFKMPYGALCDSRFEGMSIEQVYSVLKTEADQRAAEAQQQAQQKQQQQKQQQQQPSSAKQEQKSGEGQGEAQPDDQSQPQDTQAQPSEQPADKSSESTEKKEQQKKSKGEKKEQQEPEAQDDEQGKGEQKEKGEGEGDDDGDEDEHESNPEGRAEEPGESDEGDEPGDEDLDGDDGDADPFDDAPGSAQGDVVDGSVELEDGEVRAADEAELKQQSEDWEVACAAAMMQAQGRGDASASVLRMVRQSAQLRMSFEEYIEMFLSKLAKSSMTWKRRNRRFSEVYLPSDRGDVVGTLVVVVDTSGSINDAVLARFQAAAQRIQVDLKVLKMVVMYVDALVKSEEVFGIDEPVVFTRIRGGGGTRFGPAFERVKEMIEEDGEEVAGIIYLTDLDGSFPPVEQVTELPPTLWVSTEKEGAHDPVPFGEVAYFHG